MLYSKGLYHSQGEFQHKQLESEEYHSDPIYSTIFDNVKEKLLSDEALLPTHDNDYSTAKNALLARGKEISNFFTNDDIELLYDKQHWIDTRITSDKTFDLWFYLKHHLTIPTVEFENIARKISSDFLKRKNDSWLVKLKK